MATSTPVADDRLSQLRSWTLSQHFGTVEPVKFDALESTTPDETATLMLLITLRDPPEPEPTWSPDDIAALERAIRDKALELRITWPWLIHIQPETPEIEGSEEEEDEE